MILDRDLVFAGIARRVNVDGKWVIDKRDERGRIIDVHAFRTTFGTLLSKGGVAPRTAQAAMRHGDIELTMNVYTDPKLIDVAGALDALPSLPLDGGQAKHETLKATGTDGASARTLAPVLAPTPDKRGTKLSNAGNGSREADSGVLAVSADDDKRKDSLTIPVNESSSRGDWIRTSDLLNPIHCRCRGGWCVRVEHRGTYDDRFDQILRPISRLSRRFRAFSGRSLPESCPRVLPPLQADQPPRAKSYAVYGKPARTRRSLSIAVNQCESAPLYFPARRSSSYTQNAP